MKKLTIRLSDPAVIAALETLPHRTVQSTIERALAWYLVPGGFRDLEQQLATLQTGLPRTAQAVALEPLDSPEDAAIVAGLTELMAW